MSLSQALFIPKLQWTRVSPLENWHLIGRELMIGKRMKLPGSDLPTGIPQGHVSIPLQQRCWFWLVLPGSDWLDLWLTKLRYWSLIRWLITPVNEWTGWTNRPACFGLQILWIKPRLTKMYKVRSTAYWQTKSVLIFFHCKWHFNRTSSFRSKQGFYWKLKFHFKPCLTEQT